VECPINVWLSFETFRGWVCRKGRGESVGRKFISLWTMLVAPPKTGVFEAKKIPTANIQENWDIG
jgi:hypothetical protein